MDTWNYRIVWSSDGYGLHEVYYTDGVPHSCTLCPLTGYYDGLEELLRDLEHMVLGAKEPALYYDNDTGLINMP